jgi:hypothetical protein
MQMDQSTPAYLIHQAHRAVSLALLLARFLSSLTDETLGHVVAWIEEGGVVAWIEETTEVGGAARGGAAQAARPPPAQTLATGQAQEVRPPAARTQAAGQGREARPLVARTSGARQATWCHT